MVPSTGTYIIDLAILHQDHRHEELTGDFLQMEKHGGQDLGLFVRSMIGENCPGMYQFKRQSLISALGCALPRVYFDVMIEQGVVGND